MRLTWPALLISSLALFPPVHGVSAELQLPSGRSFVEVAFRNVQNHIIIPVTVNGLGPVDAFLDTGAGINGLSDPEIEKSLTFGGSLTVRGAGSGSSSAGRVASEVTFGIGDARLTGANLVSLPRPALSKIPMILGRQMFESAAVEIDFEKNLVKFWDPAKYTPPAQAIGVDLRFRRSLPYMTLPVRIDGKTLPLNVVIDTGAGHTLALKDGGRADVHAPAGAESIRIAMGMNGDIMGRLGVVDGITLGDTEIKHALVDFVNPAHSPSGPEVDGNLGGGALRRFHVTFDYARSKMYLKPNAHAGDPASREMRKPDSSIRLTPADLEAYTGAYGGDVIRVQDGELFCQRVGHESVMQAIAKDAFLVGPRPAEYVFERDAKGAVIGVEIRRIDGTTERIPRLAR